MQEFLPEAGTLSRDLSIHILATNRGNSICLFHQHHRHIKVSDGFGNGTKNILIGVPYANIVASSKDESQVPPEGHMHCGCQIDTALLDFFWWKTWVLTSTRPRLEVSEGMREDVLPPRPRAFFVQGFTEAMGMTVDDLYRSQVGLHGYNSKEVRMFQLMRMLHLVNELNARDGSPALSIGISNPNQEL